MNSNKTKENSKNNKISLKTSEAFYYFHCEKYQTQLPSIEFYLDGRLEARGSDEVGFYEINGKFEKNLIKFTKKYIGQHHIFYVGAFSRNKLNLNYYYLLSKEAEAVEKIKQGKNNAGIVFNCKAYETKHSDYQQKKLILIAEDAKANGEQNALMLEEAGIFKINIKFENNFEFGAAAPLEQKSRCALIEIKGDNGEVKELKSVELNEEDYSIVKFEDYEKEE